MLNTTLRSARGTYADQGECYRPWWKTAFQIINCFIISLACVSWETHNLQRFLRPGGGGGVPYIGYMGMCGAKGYVFSAVLV